MLINYTTEEDASPDAPDSLAPLVLAVCYSLSTVAVTMVGCRILVKAKLRKLGAEDVLIVISTVVTVALAVLTNCAVKWGFGRHIKDVHLDWWPTYSKYSFSMVTFAGVPYPLTKVSMLLFYLRLCQRPTFRKSCYCTIAYIVCSATAVTLVGIFSCTPIRAGWDHDPALHARCIDAGTYLYAYQGVNIATDVLLMALPIPIIMRLQMRPKAKWGLVAMFTVGILITAVSAYNVYAMYVAFHSADPIWDGAKSWLAAMAEFNAGIIVACMPSMLLFSKWLRGDIADGRKPSSAPSGMNDTIGGGGGGGGKKFHLSEDSGSMEYIVERKGEAREMRVVEVLPPGSRSDAGSMC